MAQTGFTPIQLYSSSTTGNTPAAADLLNSSGGSELAINIFDGKLFYKDSSGNVQVIGWKVVPVSAGGTGQTSYTDGQLLIGNSTGNTLTKATLTAGTGISITNGAGAITISATGGTGDVVGPASATDNAIARFDTTTGKLIQNSVVTISDTGAIAGATTITDLDYLDFDTTYATTLGAGQLGWNGNDTLGLGMIGGNVVQHIGEDTFFYVKASSAITKGQLCMFTGAIGASGVITAAPSNSLGSPQYIMGFAAEDIALNAFGLVQSYGTLRNVNTSAYADGDVLYYNSAVTGGTTNVYPTSGFIITVAAVTKGGSVGGGTINIRVTVTQRITASTGISVAQTSSGSVITNSAPDQVVSLTGAGTTSISGTYPSFTITSNDAYVGTVTSVAALTLGTTGTDLSSTVANGTTTPVITLNVPTASATNRGALSAADWTTFNNKGSGSVTSVAASVPSFLSISGSPITTSGTLAITYSGTALPVANGGTNATSASITAFNNITGYTATGATGTTSTNLVFSTSPTLITPVLGVATATSINKMAITAPATASTLTVADGKTLTANRTLTLTGTDGTTQTFPATSATIARTDAAQTFTGTQTFGTLAFTAISGGIAKVGSFTRITGAASGNVSYTGVGFTPSAIIMMGGVGTVNEKCWGFGTLANGQSLYSDATNANTTSAKIFYFTRLTDTQDAVIASMDADGFTLTWTRTGTGATGNAISISYIAFR